MAELQAVSGSSYIAAYGYDSKTAILTVQFQDGSKFDYAKVPEVIWQAFERSKSKGKFFHAVIKDGFVGFCVSKPTGEPSKRSDKVVVATPVYLALIKCKTLMAQSQGGKSTYFYPTSLMYYLWAACGKPADTLGTAKNALLYQACIALIVEASGKKEFGVEHLDTAIKLAAERRI